MMNSRCKKPFQIKINAIKKGIKIPHLTGLHLLIKRMRPMNTEKVIIDSTSHPFPELKN